MRNFNPLASKLCEEFEVTDTHTAGPTTTFSLLIPLHDQTIVIFLLACGDISNLIKSAIFYLDRNPLQPLS